ncbi:MAG: DUF4058 family protein [Candidatus Tectomicrobia bacterium]|uniref:DUF4058 family protein n=1 Tax=Tectimicrobiota bacterium TaxID=2528274 RepID=A0A932CPM7_UNCTE|nr:DUF4058 family protein [Candidatus Tectomicrobia bacterium]
MPSPFPGMDPYIEQPALWPDFHSDLASEIRARLNQLVQPRYFARLTPYVTYEVVEIAEVRSVRPDVGIWQPQPPTGELAVGVAMITLAPAKSLIPLEMPLELYSVEIRATEGRYLVTLIEILSPVNKRPGHEAYQDYQRKRRDLLRSAAHLLEIDLLRGGERPPLERPVPLAPYYVVLSRADHRPTVEVWPIQLADKLPVLPVPLLEPDPDVPLDLGAAVAAIYERGAYGLQIDYRQPPPPPPLAEKDAVWIDGLLYEKGLR